MLSSNCEYQVGKCVGGKTHDARGLIGFVAAPSPSRAPILAYASQSRASIGPCATGEAAQEKGCAIG